MIYRILLQPTILLEYKDYVFIHISLVKKIFKKKKIMFLHLKVLDQHIQTNTPYDIKQNQQNKAGIRDVYR